MKSWPDPSGSPARLYDLRHTHVVHLIGWWAEAGDDPNRLVPYLNIHLGHANYDDTYYYFHLVPEHFGLFSRLAAGAAGPRVPEVVPWPN